MKAIIITYYKLEGTRTVEKFRSLPQAYLRFKELEKFHNLGNVVNVAGLRESGTDDDPIIIYLISFL
jgi:hypothetical protein